MSLGRKGENADIVVVVAKQLKQTRNRSYKLSNWAVLFIE